MAKEQHEEGEEEEEEVEARPWLPLPPVAMAAFDASPLILPHPAAIDPSDPSSFEAMSIKVARELTGSEEFERMQAQQAVFVVDKKRKYALIGNEKLLEHIRDHMINNGGTKLPTLDCMKIFVKAIDSFFMNRLCGNVGRDYTYWVTKNAKVGKSLYAKFLRKGKRPKNKVVKKTGLQKPALKPPLLKVDLSDEEEPETKKKRPSIAAVGCPSTVSVVAPTKCPSTVAVVAQTEGGPPPTASPVATEKKWRLNSKTMMGPSEVHILSMNIRSVGKRVLDLLPKVTCFVCKGCIMGPEDVVVTGADLKNNVKHLTCLGPDEAMVTARLAEAVQPSAGMQLRATIKEEKATRKALHETLPSTWTEEVAEEKHLELMAIANPLKKVGPDRAWSLRYEPKQKTWERTRHQVVLRLKSDGTSKCRSFQFSEWREDKNEFKDRMLAAFDACLRQHGIVEGSTIPHTTQ